MYLGFPVSCVAMQPTLIIAIRAARAAGRILMRYLDRVDQLHIQAKSQNDFVTEVDRAAEDGETIVVKRRNGGDVAMIAADELSSILETAHLLRSPANAKRLSAALRRARSGKGKRLTTRQLRAVAGL